MAFFSWVPIFVDWAKITHSLGSKFVAMTFSFIIHTENSFSWVLDIVDRAINENHENLYHTEIQPSTVFRNVVIWNGCHFAVSPISIDQASYQLSFRYVKAEWRKVWKTNFEQRIITEEKVDQPWRKSNLICNSSYGSFLPTFIQICESRVKKSPENEIGTKVITHEKVGQPWRKSNWICNSSYGSFLSTFIQMCDSRVKKSPENEFWT